MDLADALGWIGNIGFLAGMPLLSYRKKSGFLGCLMGNTFYFFQAILTGVWSLLALSVILGGINIFGYINWCIHKQEG